jgi:endonuclease/exonuclease/phosphatase family metal-dependent hydrolase
MTAAKKGRGKSVIRGFFVGLNILFVILLLVSYLAPYISPARYWVFAFFGLAYPALLAVNLLFIILWLLFWKKYIWISLLAVAIGISHILSMMQFHMGETNPAPRNSVKILSFNVHNLYGSTNQKNPGIVSRVFEFLAQEKPAILAIQELDIKNADSNVILTRMATAIKSRNLFYRNYYETREQKRINALAIFSRFPIVRNGFFRLNDRAVFGIFTDLVIDTDTFRVFNLHLESYHFGRKDYSFYEQLTEKESEQFKLMEGSQKIFAKLKKAFIIRAQQVDVIKRSIEESPYPVIICGDFNDTPVSYTYHEMTRKLDDSFKKAGKGIFGNTFAGNFPSFRIDYILFDRSFRAYD